MDGVREFESDGYKIKSYSKQGLRIIEIHDEKGKELFNSGCLNQLITNQDEADEFVAWFKIQRVMRR